MSQAKKVNVTSRQLRGIYAQLLESLELKSKQSLPQNDSLQREVQIHLTKYLEEVFEMSQNSLNIVDAADEDILGIIRETQDQFLEKFDLELNEKVRLTYQDWEDWIIKYSQLSVHGPDKLTEIYNEGKIKYLQDLDARIQDLSRREEEEEEEESLQDDSETATIHDEKLWRTYAKSLRSYVTAQERVPETREELDKLKHLIAFTNRP
ncbi:hypothetical protein KAFR_0F01180 [Kazachstania africana CBS 2517]|uniref:Uncharacterized protein n=1 Tax=Kazachstania africana (strain ATCC 22294 / BCRC 22015 / CBS 2517 / CECT 1963 / NBRC 1671 / NRRL Y-8276) TaxID=1071382 RepID=H2AWG4_KAZAF|nr:hypothetical protein KAFR_0F01180 [Kazachstania africana CBS 2517]CCF58714.1 hypothetical protein KAFR_0F01180 [Kazachstania africana CBS 2517]